jgi:hypothetical protein
MRLTPKTTTEKLLWERHANKLLLEELDKEKEKSIQLIKELKHLKDSIRNSNHIVHLYQVLVKKHEELKKQQKDRDIKIRDLKRDVESLIIKIANNK